MFKTYQKVKKQVWFYPAMLLIVSCPLLQRVINHSYEISTCEEWTYSWVPNISVGQNKSIGRGNFLKFNNSIGNLLTAM